VSRRGEKLQVTTELETRWAEDDSGWLALSFDEGVRPSGDWRPLGGVVHVAGLHHHRAAVNEFFDAAGRGGLAAVPLELVRQPNHPYEPHAVVVYGAIKQTRRNGLFRKATSFDHRIQLGFLPRDVSAKIDRWPSGVRLGAQLTNCAWLAGEPDARAISLIVLIPPADDAVWGGAPALAEA
jgi:hypothetical protein